MRFCKFWITIFTLIVVIPFINAQKEVYLFTSFHEPATEGLRLLYSYDGYNWTDLNHIFIKPEVGTQKVMRDPSMVQGPDGTFHLVWTSSWGKDPGFGYASSKDLIHWSKEQHIDVMAYDTSTVNVWAPEIFYDDSGKQYIIVWATTIPFKFPKGQENERNNHRLYYTTTTDFQRFSPAKLFLDPGFSSIDAVIVKRAKDDYVLVVKDNTRPMRNIRVGFGKTPLGPYENISDPFTPSFTEGPTVAKVGNDWLIYYDMYRAKKYGCMKTSDFKSFTDMTDQVKIPEGHKHGTIIKVKKDVLDTILKSASAREKVHYSGNTLVNVDYHHGQLTPVVGVHNIQVLRANREHPETAENFGWTYNHAPMLAYWNQKFYLEYLSDSIGEHIPPGQTLITTSPDGYHWSKPVVVFPRYRVPDGTTKEGVEGVAKDLYSVMHQRVGFYVSKKGRLMVLAFYGICLNSGDDPNDGKGIGRVIREIYKDGRFGPVYFLRYNSAWNAKNTSYPFFTSSKDKGFVEACNEILANPLMMQQMNEESDRNDSLIPMTKDYKALSFYHLPDGNVIGLWKNALTAISKDQGKTWTTPVRAPKFVNSNAKIWGQRTSDGKYATVYNPSMFRWPLAISVSSDGLDYTNLLLVQGEITTMRYGGNFKSYGPQYVRGILEENGTPPDGNLWVTYSMNKEDIWVSKIPVPVSSVVREPVHEIFNEMQDGKELEKWNIYSPLWAPVRIERQDSAKWLVLRDSDLFDFAKAERVIPAKIKGAVSFTLIPGQNDRGILQIELQDAKGTPCFRMNLDSAGMCKAKVSYRYTNLLSYKPGEKYDFKISFDTNDRTFTVNVNGKSSRNFLFAPVDSVSRIVFRTGSVRKFPDAESPSDQDFDVKNSGERASEAVYYVSGLKTE